MFSVKENVLKTVVVLALLTPVSVFAAPLFQPGETLDPGCLPSNPDCAVSTSTTAGIDNAYASSTFPSFTYASSTYYLVSNPAGYLTLSTDPWTLASSSYLSTTSAAAMYVPYSGATGAVDLGHQLTGTTLIASQTGNTNTITGTDITSNNVAQFYSPNGFSYDGNGTAPLQDHFNKDNIYYAFSDPSDNSAGGSLDFSKTQVFGAFNSNDNSNGTVQVNNGGAYLNFYNGSNTANGNLFVNTTELGGSFADGSGSSGSLYMENSGLNTSFNQSNGASGSLSNNSNGLNVNSNDGSSDSSSFQAQDGGLSATFNRADGSSGSLYNNTNGLSAGANDGSSNSSSINFGPSQLYASLNRSDNSSANFDINNGQVAASFQSSDSSNGNLSINNSQAYLGFSNGGSNANGSLSVNSGEFGGSFADGSGSSGSFFAENSGLNNNYTQSGSGSGFLSTGPWGLSVNNQTNTVGSSNLSVQNDPGFSASGITTAGVDWGLIVSPTQLSLMDASGTANFSIDPNTIPGNTILSSIGNIYIPDASLGINTTSTSATFDIAGQFVAVGTQTLSADVIPIMTSDTTPSGSVGASSEFGGGLRAFQVFDHNTSTGWANGNGSSFPHLLQYNFPSSKKIVAYSLTGWVNSASRAPSDWTFEGHNEGGPYVVIDSQTGQTSWGQTEKRTFAISTSSSYTSYLLRITANNGDPDYTETTEIEMYTAGTVSDLKIGIGTTTPAAKLAVSVGSSSDPYAFLVDGGTGDTIGSSILMNTGNGLDGDGGALTIITGNGGTYPSSGKGGAFSVTTGSGAMGGGDISFVAGQGGGPGVAGANFSISLSNGNSAVGGAVGGAYSLVTGNGGDGGLSPGPGGGISMTTGNSGNDGSSGNHGGDITLATGLGSTNISGQGGNILLMPATATGTSVAGNVGINTNSPTATLTASGTIRFTNLGSAGANLITDVNGNVTVSSDERLKNIQGDYIRGLTDVEKLTPINYKWRPETGYDATNTYSGFSAQNVQSAIPEAVATDTRGYLTLADRPIIAALVNAVKEIGTMIDHIQGGIAYLKNIVVAQLTVGSNTKPAGITMYSPNGSAFCTSVSDNGTMLSTVGVCGSQLQEQVQTQGSQSVPVPPPVGDTSTTTATSSDSNTIATSTDDTVVASSTTDESNASSSDVIATSTDDSVATTTGQ